MLRAFRFLALAVAILCAALVAGPAQAAPPSPCSITGYTAPNASEARQLRDKLAKQSVHDQQGVRLTSGTTWKIKSGSVPIIVVDAGEPLRSGSAKMSAFGLTFTLASGEGGTKTRYVSTTDAPLLGGFTRTARVRGSGGPCDASLTIVVDRSPYTTGAGLLGIVLAVVAGALAVLFARRRTAGPLARTLLGGGFGLLAGAGEGLVLHEAGLIKPDSGLIWLGPLAGLLLGVLLARPWRRRRPVLATPPFEAPTHAPLGRYQPVEELDRSAATVRYVAVDPETQERVLLTTVRPDAADPVAARARLDRHIAALGVLSRLRELVPTTVDGPPTAVTEPAPVTTVRRFLDGGQRFTGEQAAVVLRDALTGLAAVHAAALVHRAVTPAAIHLHPDAGAQLGTFEFTAPGSEDLDVDEAQYLSPEQREHRPLDPRSDLYTCGVLLGELLTGQAVPAPMAALIERALNVDPVERPQTAEEFLVALDEAATAAFGPDWMSLGALTGAVLVPGGAIVAAGVLATAGSAVVSAGGATSALQAAASGAAVEVAHPGTTTVVAVKAVKTGGSKAAAGIPATAGGAVAVVLTAVAVFAGPTPAAAANEVIDPATARIVTVSTWGEARGGNRAHVGSDLGGFADLLLLPGIGSADLTDIQVGIPRGQTSYPAYFIVTATAKLADGRTVYILARFTRESADKPWTLTSLRYNTDKSKMPVPAIGPDGYVTPVPPPTELAVDPATLAKRYVDWGTRTAASNSIGDDPLLALAPGDSFLGVVAKRSNAEGQFYNRFGFSAGSVDPPLMLADGTVLVTFTAKVSHDLYNQPAPAPGSCRVSTGTRTVHFGVAGFPAGEYSQVHVDWVVTVEAHVPAKSAGKATLQDGRFDPTNPSSVPC